MHLQQHRLHLQAAYSDAEATAPAAAQRVSKAAASEWFSTRILVNTGRTFNTIDQ